MRGQRNFLIGWVVVITGVVLTGQALDLWPSGLGDILQRSLPAVLIALGVGTFFRGRVPFSSMIALALTVFVVVNIAVIGFSSRSGQQRSDQRVAVNQAIGEAVTLLTVDVGVLSTDIRVSLDTSAGALVTGEFSGGRDSAFTADYIDDGSGRATLTLRETQANAFPNLDNIGRGLLVLALPAGIGLDLAVTAQQGAATLNLDQADLERLNLDLLRGDATITLPEYAPRSPSLAADPEALIGTLRALEGSITIAVPSEVGARFELNRAGSGIDPQFDATVFNFLQNDVLESRNFDRVTIKLRYAVVAPRGPIRVTEALR